MVKGGNTMNLQQPYSDEVLRLQTKILTKVDEYSAMIIYQEPARFESRIFETEEEPEEEN